ncbi:MAG: segregation and condensation protein B [Alphaproteobacteria bacterium]|jgi:segregation and condensation protein B
MDGLIQPDEFIDREQDAETVMESRSDPALRLLEALLFAAPEPVAEPWLLERLPEGTDLPALLTTLTDQYADHGVNLIRAGGRWAFRTAPDMADALEIEITVSRKPSRAAVETLAIIAYHQPVTRGEIEEIRGVALSKGTLDTLLEIGWIRPVGRRRTPGRPVTWGTSQVFLDHFSLGEVGDLPGIDELKAAGLLDARSTRTIFGELSSMQGDDEQVPEGLEDGTDDDDMPESGEPLDIEEENEAPPGG